MTTFKGKAVERTGIEPDATSASATLKSSQVGLKKRIKLSKRKVWGMENDVEVTLQPGDGTPRRFEIEFGIPNTAAYVLYVYEQR